MRKDEITGFKCMLTAIFLLLLAVLSHMMGAEGWLVVVFVVGFYGGLILGVVGICALFGARPEPLEENAKADKTEEDKE